MAWRLQIKRRIQESPLVPQVAFALKTHTPNRPLPPANRPVQDRTPAAPFASLLDNSAPAPDRPPQPAPDNNAARSAHADPAQQPSKSQDGKAAKTNNDTNTAEVGEDDKSDKTAKSDKTDKTDKTAKTDQSDEPATTEATEPPVAAGKTAADAKIVATAQQTGGNDATPASDGTATDGLVAVDVAADAAAASPPDPVPTITPADAIATAPAPAPAQHAATVATPAKPEAPAAPPTGNAKAADTPAFTPKTAAQSQAEATPQSPASDTDHDAIANARGEPTDSGHRAAAPPARAALAAGADAAAPKPATDAAPPTILAAPPQNTAPNGPNPAAAASAPGPQSATIPLAGVAIEIAGKALAGTNRFEIRLDPPELGRIEVRLDVDRDGNVTSRMIVDRADTLDLLRRDAGALERALQDAGLKTSNNGLQFSLRDQLAHQQQTGGDADVARLVLEDEALPAVEPTPHSYSRLAGLGGGVDIHV